MKSKIWPQIIFFWYNLYVYNFKYLLFSSNLGQTVLTKNRKNIFEYILLHETKWTGTMNRQNTNDYELFVCDACI